MLDHSLPHSATRTERLGFSVAEVGELLGCDRSTVYGLLRSGRIAYQRLHGCTGRIIVSRAAVLTYLGDAQPTQGRTRSPRRAPRERSA